MSHHHKDRECGCGGMCMWMTASKEERIQMLTSKEARLQKMIEHVKQVKDALESDTPMPSASHDE